MHTIAITGARGLIGSALIDKLDELNITWVPIDIRTNSHDQTGVDILDFSSLEKIINHCVGVVHLAAVSRVVWGEEDPVLCRKINIEGTKNVIKACLTSPLKPWMIYASSREVYGQQDIFPVNENCFSMPHNHYAKTKIEAETLVNQAKEVGLQTSIVRFSNVFGGVNDYVERVVPAFCFNALNHLPLEVRGEGSLLDFTYVEDVAKGLIRVMQFLFLHTESLPPIHFTTGTGTSLRELANLVVNLSNSSSEIVFKPKNAIYPTKFYGDNSRAKTLLNWQPEHDLKNGLVKFLKKLRYQNATLTSLNIEDIYENLKSYSRLSAEI